MGASQSTELRRWSPSLLRDQWALCVLTFLGNYIVPRLEKISKPEKKIRREKQSWHGRVNDAGKAVSGLHLGPACLQRGGFGQSAWRAVKTALDQTSCTCLVPFLIHMRTKVFIIKKNTQ